MYTLINKDITTKARRGVFKTSHGDIQTPFFMPVATSGVLKSLSREDLLEIDAQIMLSNTYHLYLRPNMEVMQEAGGLHQFANWDKPILTDSGGYQVFSLTKLRTIKEDGVEFQSHLDGSTHYFTPEKVIEIQSTIGSDIMMPLDVCAPYPCGREEAEVSVERTTQWALASKDVLHQYKQYNWNQYLFGIIQGATFQDLREQSTKEIVDIGFDGYAIGGVSVGEPVEEMFKALGWVIPHLPEDQPRYFMGIGLPDQVVKAVGEGIDMFDTVLPTRYGRHGSLFTSKGVINIRNAQYAKDFSPLDETCDNPISQNYTKSYLRHLIVSKELTGLRLCAYHNMFFYIDLMRKIRSAIEDGRYQEFQKEFLSNYNSELLETIV